MFIRNLLIPRSITQSLNGMFWDGDAGAGAATPAEPATSTPTATPAPATTGTAPASATPTATPSASTTTSQGPEGWVPSYRLRETRDAAVREAQAQWTQRESQIQAELERYKSQVQALVGVQPPQNPEIAQVRNQFGQLYPGLASLEERARDLLSMIEQGGNIQAQQEHYWQTYGRQTMDRLYNLAEKSYGSSLSEEGKRALHSSFIGFVQSSPEMTERYAHDPSIVEDYWNSFTSSFIEPARRAASATVAGRTSAALPQDKGGATAPPVTQGPKPANLDERADQAWALYQQNARK